MIGGTNTRVSLDLGGKMKAIIMAGGKGMRLKPLTNHIPKPLIPICGTPIMEIMIKQLVSYDFDDITICLHHHASLIQSYFGNGSIWGAKIDYVVEPKPMGTIGGIALINDLPENFLVVNGDILTDMDFAKLFRKHMNHQKIITVSLLKKAILIPYGICKVENDEIIEFKEKPIESKFVNMGAYVLNRRAIFMVPKSEQFGIDGLFRRLTYNLPEVFYHNGYWFDIGTPEALKEAEEYYGELNDRNNPH